MRLCLSCLFVPALKSSVPCRHQLYACSAYNQTQKLFVWSHVKTDRNLIFFTSQYRQSSLFQLPFFEGLPQSWWPFDFQPAYFFEIYEYSNFWSGGGVTRLPPQPPNWGTRHVPVQQSRLPLTILPLAKA